MSYARMPQRKAGVIEQPICDRCGNLVHDQSYVCMDDSHRLADQLRLVANLAGEALTTISRQAHAGGAGRTDSETPLAFGFEAGDATWAAANTLTTWARHCAETRGIELPKVRVRTLACLHTTCRAVRLHRALGPTCSRKDPSEHPMAVAALWLVGQLDWLRHRQEAAEAWDELDYAARLIVRTVDNRPDRWYAGPCGEDGCTHELEPIAGAKVIRCPACGAEHDAKARREWLLDQAEDQLAGAAWLAVTLTRLGRPVTAAVIRKWGERGRLLAHGHDAAGRSLYRLGEVRELVLEAARREVLRQVAVAKKAIEQAKRERERMSA